MMKNNVITYNTIIVVFFMLMLFSSCSFANEKQEEKAQLSDNTKEPLEQVEKEKKFLFENDTIKQSIKITKYTDIQMSFLYEIKNVKRNCYITYSGVALNEYPNNDPELDEDEEGFGYPSVKYLYNNEDCIIEIRLSMVEKDKIQVKSNCNQHIFCPVNSVGILR